MKGSRPPPCSGFSLIMIGEEHAVMFGGYSPGSGLSADEYVLHLPTMVSVVATYYIDSLSLNSSAGCKMLFHIQDNEHRSL